MEVRAPITGFLEAVLFEEGDVVKEGDVLYRIEPETFQAAVQQAQELSCKLDDDDPRRGNITFDRAKRTGEDVSD